MKNLERDSPASEVTSRRAATDYLVHVMGFAPQRTEGFIPKSLEESVFETVSCQ